MNRFIRAHELKRYVFFLSCLYPDFNSQVALCKRIREIFAWGILNPETFCLLNPELIPGFGTRNIAEKNRNPTKDWNPEYKFHCHRLKSSTWNPESEAWNPESKTVFDPLTWSDSRLIWPSYTISGMHKKVTMPHLSRTVPMFRWIHNQMNVVIGPLEIVPLTNL